MQFMSFFGENRTLAFVLAAVCLLIGVALVFVLFRIVFGRGIKLPGGRSRQQRLGVVDAFEVDRQRQLVIVRRDNVEHLLMIGGPNDVVVESSIIRAEARDARPTREREAPVTGLSWPAGAAATEVAAEPALAPPRGHVPEPPPPPPAPPFSPVPPPPPSAPASPASEPAAAAPRPLRAPPSSLRPIAAGERPALAPRPPLTPLRREPRPLPPFLATRAKPAEPAAAPPAPAAGADSPAAAPQDATAPPAAPEVTADKRPPDPPDSNPTPDDQPAPAPKIALDPLESLEEEMAKLLGRAPNETR
jgi:hypothetical protein